jgi:transcription initiation factor TFIIE subunit alpha
VFDLSGIDDPETINILAEVAGANSLDIIGELSIENEMDEFSLAERLGMDVKTVRKILYRLYDTRLVSFRRIKDEETGWYIYLWKFDEGKLGVLVHRMRREKVDKLRSRLDYEKENQFFICENGCTRITFSDALELGFVCNQCGSKLDFQDNSNLIKQLEDHLKEIERVVCE